MAVLHDVTQRQEAEAVRGRALEDTLQAAEAIRESEHFLQGVFEAMQEAVRRRIDQKMRFWFDFESADLVRGAYEKEGRTVPIRNAKVK